MGESAGIKGVWSYVEGGMGAVSDAIAASALQHNVEIHCNANVTEIEQNESSVIGVKLDW